MQKIGASTMSIKCLHSILKDVFVIGVGAISGAFKKVGLEKYKYNCNSHRMSIGEYITLCPFLESHDKFCLISFRCSSVSSEEKRQSDILASSTPILPRALVFSLSSVM